MNGVAIGPNSQKNIDALKKADWLVVCEIYPDETSEFWKSPGHHGRGDEDRSRPPSTACPARASPKKTARSSTPRAGCSGRTPRCRRRARRKLDQEILARIFLKVRELYQKEGGKFPDPILNAHLELHRSAAIRRSPKSRRKSTARRWPIVTDPKTKQTDQGRPAAARLRLAADDGTTSCGNWIYCGSWTEAGAHDAAPRHRRSFRPGHLSELGAGRGRRIAACCTTAPRAISTASPGIPTRKQIWWNEAAAEVGRQRRARFQSRLARPKITWVRSS